MQMLPTGNSGDGLFPANQQVTATFAESSTAIFNVMMFDLKNAATGLGTSPGDGSVFATVRIPTTGTANQSNLKNGWYGLAEGVNSAASKGRVFYQGVFKNVPVPASTAAGDGLVATEGTRAFTRASGATVFKVIAIALTAVSGGTATVLFDGINGFGSDSAS